MPPLPRRDEATDELTVHELGAPATRTSSTAHHAAGDEWQPSSARAPVLGPGVLALLARATSAAATDGAEPLVDRERQELAPAVIAAAEAVGELDSSPQRSWSTRAARRADRLISVTRVEPERTARTVLQHDESRGISGENKSGGEKFRAGCAFALHHKKRAFRRATRARPEPSPHEHLGLVRNSRPRRSSSERLVDRLRAHIDDLGRVETRE